MDKKYIKDAKNANIKKTSIPQTCSKGSLQEMDPQEQQTTENKQFTFTDCASSPLLFHCTISSQLKRPDKREHKLLPSRPTIS